MKLIRQESMSDGKPWWKTVFLRWNVGIYPSYSSPMKLKASKLEPVSCANHSFAFIWAIPMLGNKLFFYSRCFSMTPYRKLAISPRKACRRAWRKPWSCAWTWKIQISKPNAWGAQMIHGDSGSGKLNIFIHFQFNFGVFNSNSSVPFNLCCFVRGCIMFYHVLPCYTPTYDNYHGVPRTCHVAFQGPDCSGTLDGRMTPPAKDAKDLRDSLQLSGGFWLCETPWPWWSWVQKTNVYLPSGELTFGYGKSPFLMGKSTISMAIFNCYVSSPEGIL